MGQVKYPAQVVDAEAGIGDDRHQVGGSLPSVLCLAGIVVAIGGVVTTAGPSRSAARASGHARSVLLAIGAAAGFGLLQFAISGGSKYSVVMTMVAMRGTSVPVLAGIALVALRAPSGHPGQTAPGRACSHDCSASSP